jgi:signal transduction histidine kinase/ActR/RegA family two-component response regulator
LIEDIVENPNQYKSFENENICRNGERVWVTWTNKIIRDNDGNITELLCIGNDNTERKHLELQLQRAQKMEAVGMLAGGVAHDLNNILSGIVSYPDLLLMDMPAENPFRKPITRIKESGQKAAAIVEDLLTLARRGVAVNEVVNMNDIANGFMKTPEFEKLKAYHPNVDFDVRFDKELLNIHGSPVHLSKTVMNLVSNASEAMPEGGKVKIFTENRYIDRPIRGYEEVEEGDYVLLSVSDTGMGISPEDLSRIFEPFFTKKVMGRSGTGLGMAVVWATVKDHDGYIDVQSKLGKGTRCDLYFPATRTAKQSEKEMFSMAKYKGKEQILVVDDVEEQREIATSMLSRLGYQVTAVSSGEAAVDYMKQNSADLVILDMIMDPGMDGLETYKKILIYHPNQKAIVSSGYSETKRVKETLKLGAGAYIKKPYVLSKIVRAIRAELEK